jgi:hypothetical protein
MGFLLARKLDRIRFLVGAVGWWTQQSSTKDVWEERRSELLEKELGYAYAVGVAWCWPS